MAEINFDIGVKIILQSPAASQLTLGQAPAGLGQGHREIKTAAARGFKIRTPQATFVDQGPSSASRSRRAAAAMSMCSKAGRRGLSAEATKPAGLAAADGQRRRRLEGERRR